MRTIYVDDEMIAVKNFQLTTKGMSNIKTLHCFTSASDAIEHVKEHKTDAAFLDIEMPVMSGIELAKQLLEIDREIQIVFVTGFDSYALDSYKIGGRNYILKPYAKEEIEKTISLLKKIINYNDVRSDLFFKTFGNFDLMLNGKALYFPNNKAKELLALLVDKRGNSLTNSQIFCFLWEDKEYDTANSTYVRRTFRDLVDFLSRLGLHDIIIDHRTAKSIDSTKITCDYYELMKGNKDYIAEFNEMYMTQYSWAEETIPIIMNKIEELKKT